MHFIVPCPLYGLQHYTTRSVTAGGQIHKAWEWVGWGKGWFNCIMFYSFCLSNSLLIVPLLSPDRSSPTQVLTVPLPPES